MINSDRYMFEPSDLAIWKGIAYAVAYFTALIFSKPEGYVFCFNLIVFCVGCIGEYIELCYFKKNKAGIVRVLSKIMFWLLFLLLVVALFQMYAIHEKYDIFILDSVLIMVLTGLYWVVPLVCGIVLSIIEEMQLHNKRKRQENSDVVYNKSISDSYPVGYRIKP